MELAAVILLRDNVAPAALNSLGLQLLRSDDWNRLKEEASARFSCAAVPSLFPMHRPGGRPPFVVWLTSLMDCESGCDGMRLCFVFDPDRQPCVTGSMLRTVYRLTPAEVRLVEQLLAGRRPAEAAEALGITIHTVRTYLKRLYNKVGVRTQATLVRRLLQATSVPGLLAA